MNRRAQGACIRTATAASRCIARAGVSGVAAVAACATSSTGTRAAGR
jgi:hypothetical protein